MQQELMRAVVLLSILALEGELGKEEVAELRALTTILRRASRAMETKVLEDLEATASGAPQPEDT